MHHIETRTADISLLEKGIVRLKFKPGIILDKGDIFENLSASVKLSGGRHCAILEISKNASITNEAMIFAGSPKNAQYRIANALLIKPASVRLLWNFFSSFFKPTVHNAVFVNEQNALKWLRTHLDKG